jgi:cell division protein FtsW
MTPTISLLAACAATLALVGALGLDSAAVHQATPSRLYAHFTFLAVGLAAGSFCAVIPYRRLQQTSSAPERWPGRLRWLGEARWPTLFLIVAVAQLLLVLVPGLSEVRNGARRWPVWGGQPSEFAKLALIVAMADHLARSPLPSGAGLRHLGAPGGFAGVVAILILVEPDWGGAAVTAMVAAGMLLVGGARWFHLVSAAIIMSLLAAHGLLLDPHRLGRVLSFWDPEASRFGAGYQQWRSLLAIGSGGWTGQSPGEGRFKGAFVPEQETDFIFSLLAEEYGLIGVAGLLGLYAVMMGCGWRLAFRTRDPFGQYLAVGITLWITLQALIHVAVNTSSVPNKGLPLPLVSYGGTNLICLLAGVGCLISVGRYAPLAPQPDPELCRGSQFGLVLRRLWRVVRGPHGRPVRHAYQLPPKRSADPRRALAVLRAAARQAAPAEMGT